MKRLTSIENNEFKIGDIVKVYSLCDKEGNELEEYDKRYVDLFKEGKIDRIFGSDINGGYVYSIEGAKYCFNKHELTHVNYFVNMNGRIN